MSKFRVSARRRSSRISGGSFVGDDERGDDGLDAVAAEAALEKCRETAAMRGRDENAFRAAKANLPQREVCDGGGAMMGSLGRYSRTSSTPLARVAEMAVS